MLPVNDAPVARQVPDMRNSAYTLSTRIPLPVQDIDGDQLAVVVTSSDPSIVTAETDGEYISITPAGKGSARISVTANDGEYSAGTSFEFTVGDVLRHAKVRLTDAPTGMISLRNHAERDATFTLSYNGFEAFPSPAEAAAHVQQMSPRVPGESFPRKLWRYVRDNTYHNYPLNADNMWHDMWTTLNSLGWGFCSHVAAVYVEIARAAGYDARVWGLNGHVVPEIMVDGQWQMYDPDLAVYYLDRTGNVAGVEQLAEDPSLITAPSDPVLAQYAATQSGPYRQIIADIYSTRENNFIDVSTFVTVEDSGSTIITIPPGARLLLPGRWTGRPIGYDDDVPGEIQEFRQAKLVLPEGWTGTLSAPWILWELEGDGVIQIGERTFRAGSDELSQYLKAPGSPVLNVSVSSNNGGLNLIFMINAIRYELLPENVINIRGQDVWAVDIGMETEDAGLHKELFPDRFRKPRPNSAI